MSTDEILTVRDAAVATVTVNRPAVLNALDAHTVQRLTTVMTDLGQDDEIRCVVLTGAGDRAFIAGADINEWARLTPTTARAVSDAGHRLCALIEGLGKPVIAAINGFALGGGCEIAMGLHAPPRCEDGEARSAGDCPGAYPRVRRDAASPRLVGRGRALELLLTGTSIDAEEAWRIGLVNRVVPPELLVEEPGRLAATLASQAPMAVRRILEVVHHGLDMTLGEAAVFEASTFGLVVGTEDAGEGTAAFLEKRKPRFTGR